MTPQEELQKVVDERDVLKFELESMIGEEIPTEAGFSFNFQVTHELMGTAQATFRRARSNEWPYAMNDAKNFSQYAVKNGWKFKPGPQAAPPPKSAPVEAEDNPQPKEVQSADVPPAPDGKAWLTLDVARVVVKPEPGDLVTIEFYAPGHKWPDLKANKWKIERAQGLMKHVTSHDVRKAADLSLACVVYYLNGKEKADKPGEFWKDVYHVRPDSF